MSHRSTRAHSFYDAIIEKQFVSFHYETRFYDEPVSLLACDEKVNKNRIFDKKNQSLFFFFTSVPITFTCTVNLYNHIDLV